MRNPRTVIPYEQQATELLVTRGILKMTEIQKNREEYRKPELGRIMETNRNIK